MIFSNPVNNTMC